MLRAFGLRGVGGGVRGVCERELETIVEVEATWEVTSGSELE